MTKYFRDYEQMTWDGDAYIRLQAADLLTRLEYGCKWEGMLTLRNRGSKCDWLLLEDLGYFFDSLKGWREKLKWSTYLHRGHIGGGQYDYHAHIYMKYENSRRAKKTERRKVSDSDMLMELKEKWYRAPTMRTSEKYIRKDYGNNWLFNWKPFTVKGSNGGAYGAYGAKNLVDCTWAEDMCNYDTATTSEQKVSNGTWWMNECGIRTSFEEYIKYER